jgi:cytoskeletal protein RodZ
VLLVKLLRLASAVICLIVIASFAVFAVNQTKSASDHQQEEVSGEAVGPQRGGATPSLSTTTSANTTTPATQTGTSPTTPAAKPHENSVHKALDEASSELTSPFAGIVNESDSEWATRGVRLLFALLVYGFGLGYLARVLRVRV